MDKQQLILDEGDDNLVFAGKYPQKQSRYVDKEYTLEFVRLQELERKLENEIYHRPDIIKDEASSSSTTVFNYLMPYEKTELIELYELLHFKYKVKSKDDLETIINGIFNSYSYISLNWIDTSDLTDLSFVFARNDKFNGDISEWDTSNVTNMMGMFTDSVFNGDISKWNTSNVENMEAMFDGNKKFNRDISKWNVSKVTSMHSMFRNTIFNQNISEWNISFVYNTKCMFVDAEFNQDISKWDVSGVLNAESMFWGAKKFNQNISSWNIVPDCNVLHMFDGCGIFEEYKPMAIQIKDSVENLAKDLGLSSKFDLDLLLENT